MAIELEIIVWPEILKLSDGHDEEAEFEARATAHRWLKKKQCDLLLWGRVKSGNVLAIRITAADKFEFGVNSYALTSSEFNLPAQFIADVGFAIAMRVVTTKPAGAALESTVKRLEALAKKPHPDFSTLTQSMLLHALGYAEAALARETGSTKRFKRAIESYKSALRKLPHKPDHLMRGTLLDDLGLALSDLCDVDSTSADFKEAIAKHQEALTCFEKAGAVFKRAWTLNNLGIAHRRLAERVGSSALLLESIEYYRKARRIFARHKAPSEWALIQSNLGNALRLVAERNIDFRSITEAIAAHEDALREIHYITQPVAWGVFQSNLGMDLFILGTRASDVAILRRSIAAFESACDICGVGEFRVWTHARENLGSAYMELGRIRVPKRTFWKR